MTTPSVSQISQLHLFKFLTIPGLSLLCSKHLQTERRNPDNFHHGF